MTVIGVDEGEAKFVLRCELADEIGVAAGVDADGGGEVWNQLGNLEADGAGLVDAAARVGIDRFDGDAIIAAMLAMNGGGDDRGGETGERAYLDDAAGRDDADERGEEKIIARTNPARMPDIIAVDHGVEEIELARRGNFSGMIQLGGELPIFDFELLERFEFTDIEVSRGAGRLSAVTQTPDFPRDFEAAAARPMANQIQIAREGQFQAANFAALRGQTNICSIQKKEADGLEFRAVHDDATAADFAFADDLALLLHRRSAVHGADDRRWIRAGGIVALFRVIRIGSRRARGQNLRLGDSRCAHQANEMKTALASRSNVG